MKIATIFGLLHLLVAATAPDARAEFVPKTFSCDIAADALAYYAGQSQCLATPRPGVADFRAMVLAAFPSTGDLGIMRGCNVGGDSEHKEGRAWDWAVSVYDPSDKAIADAFLAQLLATDGCGNSYALARRFGIMYMIWNKKIWKAYKPWAGWAAYTGSNLHTDHVHFSFSWDGANEDTTWWTEEGAPPEDEEQPVCTSSAVGAAAGEPFKDMPPGSFGHDEAIALLEAGITHGCRSDPDPLFCPNCPATRYQAVVFVLRAMGADVSSPPATSSFTDVPTSVWYWPYVEKAKALGLTHGCTATEFCPDGETTRAQMAKFLVQGAGWALVDPATPTFADVAKGSTFYKHIETLKSKCVTNGCGDGTNFCPTDSLTRAQAAIFIARTFDLDNANGCLDYCDPSLCNEGVQCGAWGACGGFSDACDETGTRARTCRDFDDCRSTSLDATCGAFDVSETGACSRDTDGVVAAPYGAWSACGGFDDACDTTGTHTRTRVICSAGAALEESQTEACTRTVSGCEPADVVEDTGGGEDTAVAADTAVAEDTAAGDTGAAPADVAPVEDSAAAGDEDADPGADSVVDTGAGDVTVSVDVRTRSDAGGCAGGPAGSGAGLLLGLAGLLAALWRRRRARGSAGSAIADPA
ncbi:MAG: S-layer homology domain-containing protein [Deltaproteobacteria bacterium]|nr:MAG: S-layer homology domain-containing protein [Deltaproteobacteria bacterium]